MFLPAETFHKLFLFLCPSKSSWMEIIILLFYGKSRDFHFSLFGYFWKIHFSSAILKIRLYWSERSGKLIKHKFHKSARWNLLSNDAVMAFVAIIERVSLSDNDEVAVCEGGNMRADETAAKHAVKTLREAQRDKNIFLRLNDLNIAFSVEILMAPKNIFSPWNFIATPSHKRSKHQNATNLDKAE